MSLIPTLGVKYQVVPSLRTAYDYLNKINLNVGRINLDLFPGDSFSIIGSSSVLTNTLLTKACVTSLLPKRYGGFGNSSMVFILDAGNSTDVYLFIEFIRRFGIDIKCTLNRIKIFRAFTIYQLTNFIVNEIPNLIEKHSINLIAIPDLLKMFLQNPETDIEEIQYIFKAIEKAFRKISGKRNILLVTSVTLNNQTAIFELAQTMLLNIYNKN
ncbi:MAG: hypothetical protein WB511_09155, partial [Nitrososphaeraceae archaeon]